MKTGIEYTKMVKYMLKEANQSGKYLYMKGVGSLGNPLRIIRVATCSGLTVAKTITGSEVPVSDLNFNRLYIQ